MTNDYRISRPADPRDLGPTTGHFIRAAGSGRNMTERQARAVSMQQSMPSMPSSLRVVLPLDLSEAQAFVNEVRPPHRNTARDMVVGGVLGAVLVRAVQNRRAR